MSLQRQIKTINRKVNDRTQYSQYQATNNQVAIGHGLAISSDWQPAVFAPIVASSWTPIFQTEANDPSGNKFRGRSIGFEHMIQINTIDGDGLLGPFSPAKHDSACACLWHVSFLVLLCGGGCYIYTYIMPDSVGWRGHERLWATGVSMLSLLLE